jgi:hypothetical protein
MVRSGSADVESSPDLEKIQKSLWKSLKGGRKLADISKLGKLC